MVNGTTLYIQFFNKNSQVIMTRCLSRFPEVPDFLGGMRRLEFGAREIGDWLRKSPGV